MLESGETGSLCIGIGMGLYHGRRPMVKADYDKGEYQRAVQISNTLVYAAPTNIEARYLCADALEQLGYPVASGSWRDACLAAAQELRLGTRFLQRGCHMALIVA